MQRDFYRLMGKKHGSKIFHESGIRDIDDKVWEENQELFMQWVNGETGVPFIDAHMREIKHTGYMSNRGRQNVSSFLINDLGLNWVMGADYFESQLIGYDVCSNYCNWGYAAGVGSDPKEYQNLNIISQAKRFDPNGEYVKYWLPELSMLPAQYIHQPDQLSNQEQEDLHFMIGDDYPKALVSTDRWAS
jgi:deoxyribodipyrimidine photo-lyase